MWPDPPLIGTTRKGRKGATPEAVGNKLGFRKAPIVFSNGSMGSGSFLSGIGAFWVSAFSTCSSGT
jgi:hypothetical protein